MVTPYHPARNLSKIDNRLHVKFAGGCLCLDFVNTVGGRDDAGAALRDKIAGYPDWLAWSRLAGMLDRAAANLLAQAAATRPREAARVHQRALRLREALYRIFHSAANRRRPPAPALALLRREISAARARQVLAPRAGCFVWTFPAPAADLDRILWPVALSAADLLTSPDLARVGQCRGPQCGWLFLDTSRNHRRQWCDMQDCGNRAKVRRFREKSARA